MTEKGSKIKAELEDRLDDLFSVTDDDAEGAPDDATSPEVEPEAAEPEEDTDLVSISESTPPAAADADIGDENDKPSAPPLLDLNATILSLDWEITDATLSRLIKEIDRLKTSYERQKLPFMFLQLLGSIGKYISVKKVNAHPDSIKLLHSVYNGFEKIITSPDLPDLEKKKILSNEVRQFKSLKQRIRVAKTQDTEPQKPVEVVAEDHAVAAETVPDAMLAGVTDGAGGLVNLEDLLTHIRKAIRDELSAFKTELSAMLGDDR